MAISPTEAEDRKMEIERLRQEAIRQSVQDIEVIIDAELEKSGKCGCVISKKEDYYGPSSVGFLNSKVKSELGATTWEVCQLLYQVYMEAGWHLVFSYKHTIFNNRNRAVAYSRRYWKQENEIYLHRNTIKVHFGVFEDLTLVPISWVKNIIDKLSLPEVIINYGRPHKDDGFLIDSASSLKDYDRTLYQKDQLPSGYILSLKHHLAERFLSEGWDVWSDLTSLPGGYKDSCMEIYPKKC